MEYRQLGRSGLRVSVIGLGGNTFGRYTDEERTAAIVSKAIEVGINFFDTADVYTEGESERILGLAATSNGNSSHCWKPRRLAWLSGVLWPGLAVRQVQSRQPEAGGFSSQ